MKGNKAVIALALAIAGPAALSQEIRTTVNGTRVMYTDVDPLMMNGRVMVPMRGVFEHMGAEVDWNPSNRTVYASRGSTDVKLPIGSKFATVDGNTVELDSPAIIARGRTMVPLRFVAEALGADVQWVENTRTVVITTANAAVANINPSATMTRTLTLAENTVLPLKLNTTLSSRTAQEGDKFTATLDTKGNATYIDLPAGTVVEGHVDAARPKNTGAPGILGLEFDRIRFPSGQVFPIDGSLIALDSKNVDNENGRLIAKAGSSDNMKYVGIGAGAGAVLAVLTKGNVLTNAAIGAALGYLYGEATKQQFRDVSLKQGTSVGMKLDSDARFVAVRVPRD